MFWQRKDARVLKLVEGLLSAQADTREGIRLAGLANEALWAQLKTAKRDLAQSIARSDVALAVLSSIIVHLAGALKNHPEPKRQAELFLESATRIMKQMVQQDADAALLYVEQVDLLRLAVLAQLPTGDVP